ncbi:MAG: SRPBCC family protein, partial [Pseudomonadota bacterium]
NNDERFLYQVWGFTASNARALSHIRGEFRYEPVENGQTRVTWTYSIAPRFFLVRPFVRSFLKNDFAPFMESGLQGAAKAYNQSVVN